jgi:hypothetical protein
VRAVGSERRVLQLHGLYIHEDFTALLARFGRWYFAGDSKLVLDNAACVGEFRTTFCTIPSLREAGA